MSTSTCWESASNPKRDIQKAAYTKNGLFSIEIPESFVGGEISIIDLTGKVVMKDRVTQSAVKRFDVSNLNDGIYLIRMNNGSAQFTDRLIKK